MLDQCCVELWDVGGSQIYEPSRSVFYLGADAVILVYVAPPERAASRNDRQSTHLNIAGRAAPSFRGAQSAATPLTIQARARVA